MFKSVLFESTLVLKQMTKAKLAKTIGIDESTLSRKIKNNGNFSRDEIKNISIALQLTKDEIINIFFA